MDGPVLERVHKLPNAAPHEFTEWALRRRPSSVKAFCDLFRQPSSDGDSISRQPMNNRYIWVNDNALVRYYSKYTEDSSHSIERQGMDYQFPPSLQRISYIFILKNEEEYCLHIHAFTQDAADECVSFLCSLEDSYFSNAMVSPKYLPYFSSPAGADQHSQYRFDAFYNMDFSCEQQHVIVASSKRILLCHCRFRDGGAAVLDALRAAGRNFPLIDLYMEGDSPFDNDHWVEFMTLLSEKRLVNKLDLRGFAPRPSCRTSDLAVARVGNLIVRDSLDDECRLKIIESVYSGTSPDGLDFKGFDSLQMWKAFGDALASPYCRLKRLKLYDFDAEHDHFAYDESFIVTELGDSLCRGLLGNQSLVELAIGFTVMDCQGFLRIIKLLENHPTLRSISFGDCNDWSRDCDLKVFTEAWSDTLQRNRTIQYIEFDDELYDERVFNKCVLPQLLRNRYMTLIQRSQRMHDAQRRAFFVGKWVEESVEEHSSPSITFMLLRMNTDIIASHLNQKYNSTQ